MAAYPWPTPQATHARRIGEGNQLPAYPALIAAAWAVAGHWSLAPLLAQALLFTAAAVFLVKAVRTRAPFLDSKVMDLAARLPERDRVRGLTTKVFLKRYAVRYLPRDIVHRRKRGLSVPVAAWLRGTLYGWASDRLGEKRLSTAGIDAGGALRLLEARRQRRADHGRALWTLLVFDQWLEWNHERMRRTNAAADMLSGGTGAMRPYAA